MAGRGRTALASFSDQTTEAAWLVHAIQTWQAQAMGEDPSREITIGVLTRRKLGGRRDVFFGRARDAGVHVETWDYPLHHPEVVQLLRKHIDGVLATVKEPMEQLERLYQRCVGDVPAENASTLIDLGDAVQEIADLILQESLRALVDRIRIGSDVDIPVGPGVHMLTGHAGKGQGFDKVVILGFEEGQIPSFLSRGSSIRTPRSKRSLPYFT